MVFSCPVFVNASIRSNDSAITWGGRSVSWLAMNNYVHSTSRYLKEISVKKGSKVILTQERSPAFYIVLAALWRIGAYPCPVDPALGKAQIEGLHQHLDPHFVIADRASLKSLTKGVRHADIEHVVAYGYNDSFLGSDQALDPKLDSDYVALMRFYEVAGGVAIKALTHEALSKDPQDLRNFMQSLSTGQKLVISSGG